jgi:hypothetical protein
MKRIAAEPAIFYDEDDDLWMVQAVDPSGDGGLINAYFDGVDAEERALEYALEKFSVLPQHAKEPQRYQ